MGSLIEKLNFGMDSAEMDQIFIEKAFLYTSVFDRIKTGKKYLVLGRKGSGKTAVCLKLYDLLDKQGAKVSRIEPKNLQKFKISMIEKSSLNSDESSLLAWKYVFLVQLGKYLLEDAKSVYGNKYSGWSAELQQIYKFIPHNKGGKSSWLEKTFRIFSRIKSLGVKTPVGEASMEFQAEDIHGQDFDDKLSDITEFICSSLQALAISPIYLLVDKVDEIWDSTPESKQLIIGLLRATKEILEQFKHVHIIIFLRSDIYESLEFHDSDKFHTMEEYIRWNKDDLREMIVRRAKLSVDHPNNQKVQEIEHEQKKEQVTDAVWQNFFPSSIKGKNAFEYLLQYTFMRPRDLILLCNLCRDRAQNNGHQKIEEQDIFDALPDYSQKKLQDLRDEYRIQYPFLESVFLTIFYHAPLRLTRETIEHSFNRVKERLTYEFGSYYFQHLDKLLQILYEIGFLGVIDKNTARYSFLGDNVIIAYISRFEIHPVFRWILATEHQIAEASYSGSSYLEKKIAEMDDKYQLEDFTIEGSIKNVSSDPPLIQANNEEEVYKLREAILKSYSREELEILTHSLNIKRDLLGSGSLERIVLELIAYCRRRGLYQKLVRQVLIDHPELVKAIL